jgi:hypothetical protein
MASSRDGASKALNGFDPSARGDSAKAPGQHASQASPLAGLVDELAQALGVQRDPAGDARPAAAPFSPSAARVSAAPASGPPPTQPALPVAVGRHLFDDEDDDASMPIPSTWRVPPEQPRKSSFNDQLRAAALGFGTGLLLVVPAVLLLTGKLGDWSLPGSVLTGGRTGVPHVRDASSQPASPPPMAEEPAKVQQLTVPTVSIAAAKPASDALPAAALAPPLPEAKAPVWGDTIREAEDRIAKGDILGARELLGEPASAEHGEALLLMAETFDPNMLAAWGIRDVVADAPRAKALYARALKAGVERARGRLRALE